MDHDPRDFRALDAQDVIADAPSLRKPVDTMTDDEFDAWMESLPPAPGIRSIDDDDHELAQAETDAAAGKGYPHSLVSRWLGTWGSPDYKPFQEWLKSSG